MSYLKKLALAVATAGFSATAASAQVVVAGTDAGAFANAAVPNNSTRTATEFWDNVSADESGANVNCNIGFFALGTLSPGCVNQTPGSNPNQGGYTNYWGDGPSGRDPSSFMFNGLYSYSATLLGAYSGNFSEMGWFTRDAGNNYVFNAVGGWGSKTVGTSIVIPFLAAGTNWGFYIRNNTNTNTGGCFGSNTDCSDATGGFAGAPYQQFALFTNNGETKYLVGAEDNFLELMPNGSYNDSDYNDYIFTVSFAPEPMTMGLLATGLVGLAAAGVIRRRKNNA